MVAAVLPGPPWSIVRMRLSLGMKAKIVAITLSCCIPLLVLSVRGPIVAAGAAILLCNPGGGQAESLSLGLHLRADRVVEETLVRVTSTVFVGLVDPQIAAITQCRRVPLALGGILLYSPGGRAASCSLSPPFLAGLGPETFFVRVAVFPGEGGQAELCSHRLHSCHCLCWLGGPSTYQLAHTSTHTFTEIK